MPNLDPYPWITPGKPDVRWGSEYPKYDGLPMTHLNLEFSPHPGYSQERQDYPECPWTAEELAYARGYHSGFAYATELYEERA